MTRYHTFCNVSMGYEIWPSCADHYNLTFAYDAFYDWIWDAGYAPHGPVHYYVGGYGNCGDLEDAFSEIGGDGAVESFARLMVLLPKQMWRAYLTESPTCSVDTPQAECHMKCVDSLDEPKAVDALLKYMAEAAAGLAGTGIPVSFEWLQTLDETRAAALARLFCSTPFTPGEQLEAASPADVSFWPIHPTVERLLQYKRLVSDFASTNWADPDPRAITWYCQEGITVEAAWAHNMSDGCEGHHAVDSTLFPSRVRGADGASFSSTYLSNAELLDAVSPATYRMAYVYDGFDWDHCADAGVAFPEVPWSDDVR